MKCCFRLVAAVAALASLAAAAKRDDSGYGGSPVYSTGSGSGSGSGSAYTSASGYGNRDQSSGSASSANGYSSLGSSQYGDSVGTASGSVGSGSNPAGYSSQNGNGNLYYYYYPMNSGANGGLDQAAGKNQKDIYQAAASSQYGSLASGDSSSSVDGSNLGGSSGDLNFSGDLQGYNTNQGNSYSSSNLGNYGNQNEYSNSGSGQNFGTVGSATSQQNPSFVPAPDNSANQFGSSLGNQFSGASNIPSFSNIQNQFSSSALQQGGNNQFGQGQNIPNGNLFSASNQFPSFGNQFGNSGPQGFSGMGPNQFPNFPGLDASAFGGSMGGPNQGAVAPAPSSGRKWGIGSVIMPMLALAGLSLLIPTVTSLSSAAGRKKRSVAEESAKETPIGYYLDRIEKYYSIYRRAAESEECMNRIICELGDAMSGVKGKSAIVTIVDKVVPQWMGNKVGVFKSAALSGDFGKCKKFTC